MTPTTRAEKIVNEWSPNPMGGTQYMISVIAAQIEEAEREAYKRGYDDGKKNVR